jgi:hypothetical protein
MDPENWHIFKPTLVRAVERVAAIKARRISLAYRQFHGRKASKLIPI